MAPILEEDTLSDILRRLDAEDTAAQRPVPRKNTKHVVLPPKPPKANLARLTDVPRGSNPGRQLVQPVKTAAPRPKRPAVPVVSNTAADCKFLTERCINLQSQNRQLERESITNINDKLAQRREYQLLLKNNTELLKENVHDHQRLQAKEDENERLVKENARLRYERDRLQIYSAPPPVVAPPPPPPPRPAVPVTIIVKSDSAPRAKPQDLAPKHKPTKRGSRAGVKTKARLAEALLQSVPSRPCPARRVLQL